jgi:hypothetical protein
VEKDVEEMKSSLEAGYPAAVRLVIKRVLRFNTRQTDPLKRLFNHPLIDTGDFLVFPCA